MRIFASIVKRDDEQRMVYGYASTEALDSQGERVSKAAIESALPDYMRWANVREMHQPSAVGVTKTADIDEKGLYIACKIVDDVAWGKVKGDVYKGFSIGGKSVNKVEGVITELRLTEISLVDRPANPEAVIDVWKAEGPDPAESSAVTELAKLVDDKAFKPSELLELAKRLQIEKDAAIAALPDGTFKILKAEDLRAALRAFARAKDQVAVREHIVKRAKVLALEDKLPAVWKVGGANLEKGLYQVSWLAQLLDSIACIQADSAWEAASEGDSSVVPAALKDWLEQGTKILCAMASEESAELMGLARAEPAGNIGKGETTVVNAETKPLVTDTKPPVVETAVAKVETKTVTEEDLAKVAAELTKRDAIIETLGKRLKALEDQPLPPKGVVRVVDKSGDTGGAPAVVDVEPIKKVDGTIDDAATEMKKVHATGGRRVFATT